MVAGAAIEIVDSSHRPAEVASLLAGAHSLSNSVPVPRPLLLMPHRFLLVSDS